MLSFVLEPLLEHFDLEGFSLVPAHQQRPWHGQAPVARRMIRSQSCFALRTSTGWWRGKPQVAVPGQCGGPSAGPLAKITLPQRLYSPSDAPHQMLPVARPRRLTEQLGIAVPQLSRRQLPQRGDLLAYVFRHAALSEK